MKKWNILSGNNRTIDPNVLRQPQNVENFLKEIDSMMSFIQGNSYCRCEFNEELNKDKAKVAENPKECESCSESVLNEILLTTVKRSPAVSEGSCSISKSNSEHKDFEYKERATKKYRN